jgi:hypothetical protein
MPHLGKNSKTTYKV